MDSRKDTFVHYPQVSWRTNVADSKPIILLTIFVVVVTVPAVFFGTSLSMIAYRSFGLAAMFIFDFVFALLIGSAALKVTRVIYKRTFGKSKTELRALEQRAMADSVPLTLDETHKLIDCALKSKHLSAADFYSEQVMALSMVGTDTKKDSKSWMLSTDCWASTASFDKQLSKKLWTPYETRGVFSIGTETVSLQTKKFSFECYTSQIKAVEIKFHSKWVKPMPAKYIYLTIFDDGIEHGFVIAPSVILIDTIWECNKLVEQWVEHINKARSAQ